MATAIVTGGSRGIGLGISKELAKTGYNTVIAGVRPTMDKLDEFEEYDSKVIYVPADVSKKEARENLLKTALQEFGSVDVLVNNAGVAPKERKDILEISEEDIDYLMDINFKGSFLLSQIVAKQMMTQTTRMPQRIINISSISAYTSSINRGEYCVSKAAVSMTTKLFADRLAQEGIRVFELRPGIIETDMTAGVKEKYDKLIGEGLIPIGRWGKPSDIAGVVVMLCKREFDYCTGDIINIDGGFHIRRL